MPRDGNEFTDAPKTYRDDAVFPQWVEVDVPRNPGEGFLDYYERKNKIIREANPDYLKRSEEALHDPKNMTTSFLAHRVASFDAMRIGLGQLPWSGAKAHCATEPKHITAYRDELQRRAEESRSRSDLDEHGYQRV